MSFSDINIQELASAFMVLFAVIDITGAVPIINAVSYTHLTLPTNREV